MSQPESQGSSTMEQAREGAQQMGQQVQEKTQEAKATAGQRVREQVDQRSTQAGEQVGSMAGALRKTSQQLREEGNDTPARLAEQGANQVERLGSYLRESNADEMLRAVEGFGRRRPMVFAAGAALLGFAASRFLGASSRNRYESQSFDGGPSGASYQRVPSPGVAAYGGTGSVDPVGGDLAGDLRPQPQTAGNQAS